VLPCDSQWRNCGLRDDEEKWEISKVGPVEPRQVINVDVKTVITINNPRYCCMLSMASKTLSSLILVSGLEGR
jgi:hypothetical protein